MGEVSAYTSACSCAYVVDASAGCTLCMHGFLAFFMVLLFAFKYCPSKNVCIVMNIARNVSFFATDISTNY